MNDGIASFRAVDYGGDNSARVGVTRRPIDAFCVDRDLGRQPEDAEGPSWFQCQRVGVCCVVL